MGWSLPRAQVRMIRRTGGSATLTGGEGDAELAEEAVVGVLRFLGSTVRLKVILRWCHRGQGGRETTGGEELSWRTDSPAAAARWNSGAARLGIEDGRLGRLPGCSAELLRWFTGVEVAWARVGTAVQRALRGRAGRRWCWGSVAAVAW